MKNNDTTATDEVVHGEGFSIYNGTNHNIAVSVIFTFGPHIYCEGYHYIGPGKRKRLDSGAFNAERVYYITISRENITPPQYNWVHGRNEIVVAPDPNGVSLTIGRTNDSVAFQESGSHPRREFTDATIADEIRNGDWRGYKSYCVNHFRADLFEVPCIRMHPQSRSPYYDGILSITEGGYVFGCNI